MSSPVPTSYPKKLRAMAKTHASTRIIVMHVARTLHLFFLFLFLVVLLLGSLGLLPPDAAGPATAEGRRERKVDVLLGVEADDEGRDVDDLLSDADVALADEDTGVVDRLGEPELVHTRLQAALQEVLDLEGEHVVELHARLVEHANADQTANERVTFEETLGVLLVERQKLTADGLWLEPMLRVAPTREGAAGGTNRAARRILDSVSWTRQTSRLLRRPYSPTSFNSESLYVAHVSFRITFDLNRGKLCSLVRSGY